MIQRPQNTTAFNREMPLSMSPRGVRLEKIVGITSTHNSSFALNPQRNEVAYPAGRTVVLQDTVTGLQMFPLSCYKDYKCYNMVKRWKYHCDWGAWTPTGIAIWKRDAHIPGIASSDGVSPPPQTNPGSKQKYQRIAYLIGHIWSNAWL